MPVKETKCRANSAGVIGERIVGEKEKTTWSGSIGDWFALAWGIFCVLWAGRWIYDTFVHPQVYDACIRNIEAQALQEMEDAKKRGVYQTSPAAAVGGAFEVRFISGKKYAVKDTIVADVTIAFLTPANPDPNDTKRQNTMRCVFDSGGKRILAMEEVRK